MKYKVTLKISYMATEFLFDDRQEALDFMETAWTHKGGDSKVSEATLTFVEEVEA